MGGCRLLPCNHVSSPVSVELVAVSVPVPAQRFYGREAELAGALLAWVSKVDAWFNGTEDRK